MKPDLLGAPASNAGDDFHEWWALRSALRLLHNEENLIAITVEGISLTRKQDQGLREWDSVDCGMYYGGHTVEDATEVIIEQLKYSASTPEKPWTVSELTKSKSKKSNNSIIKGLADTFSELLIIRPDLVKANSVKMSLVSNRPLGADLQRALNNKNKTKYEKLRLASDLNKNNFRKFIAAFDYSNCGSGSRFEQEEKAINEILAFTQSADRGFVLDLKDQIHKLMLPEGMGRYITKETVLTWLNVSDPMALFPCPPQLKPVAQPVARTIVPAIRTSMIEGNQFLCLHGEGGCGKTTVLRQVEDILPAGSAMVIYDCYGAGTYLDSEAYRHRPKDVYRQIINDCSTKLKLPLLINQDISIEFLSAFSLRMKSTSTILKAQSDSALLVVVIDAADNSIAGAKQCRPEEDSFIHELLKIGSLPSNVRIIVTARTGRLSSLVIPEKYLNMKITNFSLDETTIYVHNHFSKATDEWVEDFHNLSRHNPRVQSYAFEYAGSNPSRAIDYLRPNGLALDQIFEERFKEAVLKEGNKNTVEMVCSGLIALPSPVPKKHLASVLGLSEDRLNDVVSDLPGIRVLEDKIGFLDEDVEEFVREKAKVQLPELQNRVAEYLFGIHNTDEYAAMHVAGVLYSSGQGQKIIEILKSGHEPVAIKDQIIKREVQRRRLQLAMKVCRLAGKSADAIFTLLVGAEAIKTDEAVDKIIMENPDLSVYFAADSVGRNILYSSRLYKHHGSFLAHIIARDAADNDFIAAREKQRIYREWFNRRSDDLEKQKCEKAGYPHNVNPWPVEIKEIAAHANAILDMHGYQAAYKYIRSWTPRRIHFDVALILINRLLLAGKEDIVKGFLDDGLVPNPWASILEISVALAGYKININKLEKSLCNKYILKFCNVTKLSIHLAQESSTTRFIELVLSGCELLAAHGRDLTPVIPIIRRLCPDEWRLLQNIYTHESRKNDIGFRAYSLLSRFSGNEVKIETYLIDPPVDNSGEEHEIQARHQKLNEQRKELKEKLSTVFDVYAIRADILLSNIALEQIVNKLDTAIHSMLSNSWRLSREHHLNAITDQLSIAIGKLIILPNIEMSNVYDLAKSVHKHWPSMFSNGQRQLLANLIQNPALKQEVISDIYKISNDVKTEKISASDKISVLLDLSRILVFVDREEAREVFKIAVAIANDVDVDAMHEVSLFSILSRNARAHLTPQESIYIASQMSDITTEYGIILDGYEDFPWKDAISAIATLDMAKAISLIGFWEDADFSSLNTTIPALLSIGIEYDNINVSHAISLLNFCDSPGEKFLTKLVASAPHNSLFQFIEELSRAELLRFDGDSAQICEILNERVPYDNHSGFWHSAINRRIKFKLSNKESQLDGDSLPTDKSNYQLDAKRYTATITESDISLVSCDEFIDSLKNIKDAAREKSIYIGSDDIIKHIAENLSPGKRLDFLSLLSEPKVIDNMDYSWAKNLVFCLDLWSSTSHVIANWNKENLPLLIANYLSEFTYGHSYGYKTNILVELFKSLELSPQEIVNVLLDGLEKNADLLPLEKLYTVIGLLSEYCDGAEVADVTRRYTKRLSDRLNLAQVNTSSSSNIDLAFAQQLYSLLGDVDTRVRWRAAHSIRALARIGSYETIAALTTLYDRTEMPGYRDNEVPFYWMAARLWLVITLDRLASEVPDAVVPVARWLLEVATDEDFPHVLMRHFAKSSLLKLIEKDNIDFDASELALVQTINIPTLKKKMRNKRSSLGGFHDDSKKRRFHFDSLDTLRYVYPNAINCFADIDDETFLDVAESWIVDKWKVNEDAHEWKKEPRRNYFERVDYTLYSHSHGSNPTIERNSYYLEWHALWCSIGSIMKSSALALSEDEDDDYGTLGYMLKQEGLTQPPHWASDIRCPTPNEKRFHYPSIETPDVWIDLIKTNDFDTEIGLIPDCKYLTVDSYHDIRTSEKRSTVRISSALVSSVTALPLVRALQTSRDSHDYRLPPVGNDLEIDEDNYKLKGWVTDYYNDPRIDSTDPFNHGVRMIESAPSKNVIEVLGLDRTMEYPVCWIEKKTGEEAFIYETWGVLQKSGNVKEYISNNEIISDGHWLKISKDSLKKYLSKVDFDLIVEVEITRRIVKDGITSYDEDAKEKRFARLYLLRGTGEVFTVEGRIGSWAPSHS
jgi:hypothetical protein